MKSKSFLPLFAFLILLGSPGRATAQSGTGSPQKGAEAAAASEDLREMAKRILNELRVVDGAMDQWAIENNKASGAPIPVKELAPYFKSGSPIQKAAAAGKIVDALGNPISVVAVETPAAVSQKTFDQLASVASAEFWGIYMVK